MKKFIKFILVAFLLVGCAIEDSPEYYFDTALVEVESLEEYQTHVKVMLNNSEVLLECDAVNKDMQTNNASTTLNWTIGSPVKGMEEIATFNYANLFNDFSYDNGVVHCSIPVGQNTPIEEMINTWSDEGIETIDHIMYLDGTSLSSVEIIVKTNTQTFTYTITINQ